MRKVVDESEALDIILEDMFEIVEIGLVDVDVCCHFGRGIILVCLKKGRVCRV
jgi:hypothetical protein